MNTQKLKMLLQRELWEHKGALIWTPAIVAVLFILLSLAATISVSQHIPAELQGGNITIDDVRMTGNEAAKKLADIPYAERAAVMKGILYVQRIPFDLLMLFLLPFYCIASLYDERKDRSIAFWRSMPVADWESVGAKLLTAGLVFPAIVLLCAAAFQIVWLAIGTVPCWYFGFPAWDVIWAPSQLPLIWIQQYIDYVLLMLWSLPFLGLLMLVAAATRRPFVWAILPLLLLGVSEFWVFDTHHVFEWIGDRIRGSFEILYSNLQEVGNTMDKLHGSGHTMDSDMTTLTQVLSNGQFWIGIALGLVLLYGAVQMRRRAAEL